MSPTRRESPAVHQRRCTKYFGTTTTTSREEPRRRRRRLPAHVATHLSVFAQNPRASRTLSVQFTKASLQDITVLGQVTASLSSLRRGRRREQALVQHHEETLQHWGFTINARQELTTAPFVEHRQANEDDCTEYLTLLADADRQRTSAPRPPVILRLLHSRACRNAIMFGDVLSQRACELLLGQLSHCRLPFQCAHGRPSLAPLVQLDEEDAS
ncbi:hypothetical protein SPRG_05874 [Saprolegnia parasitica CBS 223.65]|uniref:MutL C-terminal dimerisation domain-containing protein n=1 Tax=Saprolegnia parasitica (strain CBS 223.65) TaxID=695850 RepID=A0A067CFS1_SAPPC|nr:hypothetical protein SPRG_05874 [Saprolegnia parasitica CBS 223.65]KDO29338.1 hypothetical protein SPRG_05874 [Saprolegnia parasitica CBS 223.65]|eukprot:XP_012199841.1 hypothetical protein SPRG_05874 [Saprolegnia parasitica CBS 223.65]